MGRKEGKGAKYFRQKERLHNIKNLRTAGIDNARLNESNVL